MDHTRLAFSIVHPAIIQTMGDHWKRSTQLHCLNALRTMQELDPYMFEELKLAPKKKPPPPEKDEREARTARNWSRIARLAAHADQSLVFSALLVSITQTFGEIA
jgi:hypothetical protein